MQSEKADLLEKYVFVWQLLIIKLGDRSITTHLMVGNKFVLIYVYLLLYCMCHNYVNLKVLRKILSGA